MNELNYQLLFDNTLRRRVKILLLILETSNPIEITFLQAHCRSTKKTIYQDLLFLTEELPNSVIIIESKKVYVKRNDNTAEIITFLNSININNPLHIIIESIFENSGDTISTFSEKLFVSESTIRKYLNLLKSVLKEYRLSVLTKPVEIIGNELDIRYFYFHYFRNMNIVNRDSSLATESKKFYEIINYVENRWGFILTLDFYRMIHWWTIFKKRIAQNKVAHFDSAILEKYRNTSGFITSKNILLDFFPELFSENYLNEHEILLAYIIILDCVIYGSGNRFITNDFSKHLVQYNYLTTAYFEKEKLDFCSYNDFKIIIEAFLTNLAILSEFSPLFQKKEKSITQMVLSKYPNKFKIWLDLLEHEPTFSYKEDVAVSLTLLTEANSNQIIRVLFAFTAEPVSINYYKSMILNTIPQNIEAHFLFNQPLDAKTIKNLKIKVCVCNFNFAYVPDTVDLIQLPNNPSESEFKNLTSKILNLANKLEPKRFALENN
ncbi:helix-turn-helix domain-containing protein [Enterococcus rivorum]|uniref:Mga helix-turn-helix domain-containing protein n=1 Tax=Enterococcus rivorum TaxID=762845 RepID=A0A1E5KXN3_9ENTE|nr:helix-turn-helix domain-containing protein [Enterococcus rivorum]MBP2099479.1 hypothetical protein [Enterococcus rivorum]OEH82593.1 hypothetical protein BCR26_12680 [Enterococcus rivorum]